MSVIRSKVCRGARYGIERAVEQGTTAAGLQADLQGSEQKLNLASSSVFGTRDRPCHVIHKVLTCDKRNAYRQYATNSYVIPILSLR